VKIGRVHETEAHLPPQFHRRSHRTGVAANLKTSIPEFTLVGGGASCDQAANTENSLGE
jgi:hypothetical protein